MMIDYNDYSKYLPILPNFTSLYNAIQFNNTKPQMGILHAKILISADTLRKASLWQKRSADL